jgi:hypothetical protein
VQFGVRLSLDDNLIVDDQVKPLYPECMVLVHNLHTYFAGYTVPSRAELSLHSPDVKVLEKPVPERVVNLEKRTDHGAGESLFNQLDMRHPVESGDEANKKSSKPRRQNLSLPGADPKHQPLIRRIRVRAFPSRWPEWRPR